MYATLMTAVLLAQAPQPATQQTRDTQSLDGTWTVLCFEKDGQSVPEAKNMTITIRNNVATCSGDEKKRPKSMRLEFAQGGKIRVTELDTTVGTETPAQAQPGQEANKNAKTGHFIMTKDFFTICLKDQAAGERPGAAQGDQPMFGTAIPQGKPDAVVVILKRSETGNRQP